MNREPPPNFAGKACPTAEQISHWHDGEGEQNLHEHLAQCPKCRALADHYARIDRAICARLSAHDQELADRIVRGCRCRPRTQDLFFNLLRAAAVLMIILGLAGMFLQREPSAPPTLTTESPATLHQGGLDGLEGDYLVLIKIGDQLRPLHGPRLAEPRPRTVYPVEARERLVGIEQARRQAMPSPVVLPRDVRHVWVVGDLAESRQKLLNLLPEGTRCSMPRATEGQAMEFTFWLGEEQVQTLVDRMADELGWALVSSELPQPGQGTRLISRGGEIQYTCNLIVR